MKWSFESHGLRLDLYGRMTKTASVFDAVASYE